MSYRFLLEVNESHLACPDIVLKPSNKFFHFLCQIRYIQPGIPSGVDVSSTKVSAIIGTDSSHCHISELIWRMGPTCLLEEPLLDDAVNTIYKLGPNYSGCFQAPVVNEYFEVSQIHVL